MARAMFILKGGKNSMIFNGEAKVVERIERDVPVRDGDEIVCMVVGTARVFGNGHEVEIVNPRFEKILEVRKVRPQ